MHISFIGRGPEAHVGRQEFQQQGLVVSARDHHVPESVWKEMIHGTELTVVTTTEEGWPLHLPPTVAAILDVAGFKSRRHGILFLGPLDPMALQQLKQREDLSWFAHAPELDGPVTCEDLAGLRTLARLGLRIAPLLAA